MEYMQIFFLFRVPLRISIFFFLVVFHAVLRPQDLGSPPTYTVDFPSYRAVVLSRSVKLGTTAFLKTISKRHHLKILYVCAESRGYFRLYLGSPSNFFSQKTTDTHS